uniref:Uncharacterized protein n=1 Tax=Anguilla anguilla TaxID=7936 RepID=A0A0E9T9A6_ANGAN
MGKHAIHRAVPGESRLNHFWDSSDRAEASA